MVMVSLRIDNQFSDELKLIGVHRFNPELDLKFDTACHLLPMPVTFVCRGGARQHTTCGVTAFVGLAGHGAFE
jgi:hypothetical protein